MTATILKFRSKGFKNKQLLDVRFSNRDLFKNIDDILYDTYHKITYSELTEVDCFETFQIALISAMSSIYKSELDYTSKSKIYKDLLHNLHEGVCNYTK